MRSGFAPLSDRWRRWTAGACAVGLIALYGVWAWEQQAGELGYRALLVHPERYDGDAVVLSLVRLVEVQGPDLYGVEKGTVPITVRGAPPALPIGAEITVGGTWDAHARALRAEWIEARSEGRRSKRLLGVLGLVVAVWLAAARVRRGPEGLVLVG